MLLLLNEHHCIKDWIEFEIEGKFYNDTKWKKVVVVLISNAIFLTSLQINADLKQFRVISFGPTCKYMNVHMFISSFLRSKRVYICPCYQ